jgi:Glyoxalase-like domain
MRLDHLSYAAGPDGLVGTAKALGALLGEDFRDGGIHPRFGTRNMVLPLTSGTYLEVVAVLDHPSSDKAPFGQAVRARSAVGGGWLGWVVCVDDIRKAEERLGRESVQGNRHRPDGVELRWRQIGVRGLQADPQLPFFVQWQVPDELHPSSGGSGRVRLESLEIAGDPGRVSDWLGSSVGGSLEAVDVRWVAPHGTPGVLAASFTTPHGLVRI